MWRTCDFHRSLSLLEAPPDMARRRLQPDAAANLLHAGGRVQDEELAQGA